MDLSKPSQWRLFTVKTLNPTPRKGHHAVKGTLKARIRALLYGIFISHHRPQYSLVYCERLVEMVLCCSLYAVCVLWLLYVVLVHVVVCSSDYNVTFSICSKLQSLIK